MYGTIGRRSVLLHSLRSIMSLFLLGYIDVINVDWGHYVVTLNKLKKVIIAGR